MGNILAIARKTFRADCAPSECDGRGLPLHRPLLLKMEDLDGYLLGRKIHERGSIGARPEPR